MYQKRTNKKTTKDAAVSPVVGVMLMLVVTIVIAAVVTIFATGLAGTQQSAPVVSASVDLNTKDNTATITFLSVSEPVAQNDLKMSLKSTQKVYNSTSKKDEYTLYTQVETLGDNGVVTSGTNVKKTLALAEGDGSGGKYIDPTLTIADVLGGNEATKNKYLAKYTVKNTTAQDSFDIFEGGVFTGTYTGDTKNNATISSMTKVQCKQQTEPGKSAMGTYEGQFVTFNPGYTMKKNENLVMTVKMETLKAGDKVDVELLHVPSNSVIYTKTITVGA